MSGRRFEFDGTIEEKGGQQFVNGRGTFGQGFTRIHRPETHGFASMPIKGGKGLVLQPNDQSDEVFVLGGEHEEHRPKNIPLGGSAIYDSAGNIMRVVMGDGIVVDLAGAAYVIRKGGVSLTISADGFAFAGGTITHDGVVIDKTHGHVSAPPGVPGPPVGG